MLARQLVNAEHEIRRTIESIYYQMQVSSIGNQLSTIECFSFRRRIRLVSSKQVRKSSQGLKINANADLWAWHGFFMPDYFCAPAYQMLFPSEGTPSDRARWLGHKAFPRAAWLGSNSYLRHTLGLQLRLPTTQPASAKSALT
jgi:hypothetical protein